MSLNAQTNNMNFEEGTFNGWDQAVGTRIDAVSEDYTRSDPADFPPQIRLMNPAVPPFDEYGVVCGINNIPTIFPGGAFSARIGDNPGGRRAAKISRTFTVQANAAFLQYSYAIILEDPGHDENDQPKFVVNIKDSSGALVTCGKFEAFAGPNALQQGFRACTLPRRYRCDFPLTDCPNEAQFPTEVQILPWTSGGADLTPYIGQQITIEFISLDCLLGAHGATAYLEANIEPLEILVNGLCTSGDDITLTAPLGFVSYLWSTGETTRTISVTNAQFGDTYTVDLKSNTGCDTQVTIVLGPQNPATIDPIEDKTICLGARVVVIPTGTDAGSFEFTWPVNNSIKGLSASLSPTETTTYTVYALDKNGCRGASTTFTINVLTGGGAPYPEADFTYTVQTGPPPNLCNTLVFDNLSSYCKDDLTYLWDFGDGTTSTEENPTHTFPTDNNQQTYTITLTVTSASDGLIDTATDTFDSNGVAPSFDSAANCGEVTLTNTSTICETLFDNYTGFTYTWDFGDGSAPQVTDETQATVTHTYTVSGPYTIELTMTDTSNGNVYNASSSIEVITGIGADFSFDSECLSVQFNNESDSCIPITNYLWDFGDGTTSTEENPSHDYANVGPFTVTLTVGDDTDTSVHTDTVQLNPAPTTADFTFVRNCDQVVFTNASVSCDGTLTYAWDFGDGNTSTEENPTHIFAYGQTYSVTLTISDGVQTIPITKPVSVEKEAVYIQPTDMEMCGDIGSLTASFDLTERIGEILVNVDPTAVTPPAVAFYLTPEDADAGTNRINNTFENTENPQTIYASVTENGGCLVELYSFDLIVNETPQINDIEDILICSSLENSKTYDLQQLDESMFDGITQSVASLTYHESEEDAMDNILPVTSINLIAGNEATVYARAENPNAPLCYSISTFNVRLDNAITDPENCSITVSNALTPNGDGINDTFVIKNIEIFPENRITIFNRWGSKVFETRGYVNTWDGTHNGKELPVATYYYVLELNDPTKEIKSGYVSIIR